MLFIYALTLLVISFLIYYDWLIGSLFLLLFITLYMYDIKEEREIRQRRIQHTLQLTTQVEKAGETVFLGLPIGIVLYNEANKIEWVNPYMRKLLGNDNWREQSLSIISENLPSIVEGDDVETDIRFDSIHFNVLIDRTIEALFFFDATEEKALRQRYEEEKLVLAVIYLDNYEEISRNMDDNLKSHFNSMVTSALNKWAETNQFYMKRTSQDRFFAVLTEETLKKLEATKFDILDKIRELRVDKTQRNPITLSIGVGTGTELPTELAKLAQSALDLALGRGGDQVAIRDENGKVRFYGGQTNPMEKHTRVRARVISHALAELVKESDNVIIMGHKRPDMDALGAALGVFHIAQSNGVEGYIVFDEKDITSGIEKLIEQIKKEENLWKFFIRPEEAEAVYTSRSLIVVVDTNRPSLVAHEPLLHRAEYKVVIDHHRRGEDFIDDPTLVYIEPYASSTSELVTELIEYQPKEKELLTVTATALLAGIIVDTKSFALRTGSRTFDAASYLRLKGADSVLIQQFLKEDLQTVIKRNKLIERAYMFKDTIAIIVADEQFYDQVMIAQTADQLLTIDQVKAAFVIAHRDEETIAISARSLGDVNVQLIMEQLDGGGHLTNAATQLVDISLEEAEQLLQEKITNYLEERN
ncbi:MAG TPA: DHH family phosphoesterase [Pseudogracilibacillus sp.]|nr:DHH family phosphoesterase [Pseudogracilibacillus sp.]